MSNNVVNARSSIVWILAILVSFGAVWWIEKESGRELIAKPRQPVSFIDYTFDSTQRLAATRPLTPQELQWARVAWTYFANNTDAQTGLANAVDGYPSASMWDEGSYLLALLSARRIDVIAQAEFDSRARKALASLARLPLVGGLPNKAYDVHALAMTDYRNQPAPRGTGVSALDIARLAAPLQMIAWLHPQHADAVRAVVARWDLPSVAAKGQLQGRTVGETGIAPVQEGRIGYEQYAAEALAAWHLDLGEAAQWERHLRWAKVAGVQVPTDDREGTALDALVSEPFVLQGLEFGWTRAAREMAWRVYRAQEARAETDGVLTAASEDHLDRAPYFAYNAVVSRGKPWIAVSSEGQELPQLRALSTKAAFAWHALLARPYTAKLIEKVAPLNDPTKGWYAGLYEADGQPNRSVNANTNAVVLESLAYIAGGPLGAVK